MNKTNQNALCGNNIMTLDKLQENYLVDIEFETSRKSIYDEVITLRKRNNAIETLLHKARVAAKKAAKEKSRTMILLISLRNEGKLFMTDNEIAEKCFVTKKSICEAKSRLKAKELNDA